MTDTTQTPPTGRNDLILYTAEAITAAARAAKEAHRGCGLEHDGGTCNFDSVTIDFTGWRQKEVDEVAKLCGISIGNKMKSSHWKNCRFIQFDLFGQGNNRTRMMEAAAGELKRLGIPVRQYYQAD